MPDKFEYDEELHGDVVVKSAGVDPGVPDGATESDCLDLALADAEERGDLIRRVVHPGDPRAGPTAERPVVDLR